MSVPVNHMFEFQQLLAKLLSPDNDVRKLAEVKKFYFLQTDINFLVEIFYI